ncbi:hypothetical protein FA15DRAFT_681014 [Coprinopsis marcescibilis]|uniref:Helitron helicase-like domain-containing protein n=1 Tax=Coprinopsis marcescibilis TaxID=230819 RepID=A0A5C3KTZ4_COPMA|nr:hypothetical protein FA15DRAFT_681014 [Coprinopsis marcescibilis]
MYHDKHFQMDGIFVVSAFNHLQIKASSNASFLMVKRGNFENIARSLQDIDPATLSKIASHLKEGGRYQPQNDQEKHCFKLMEQIEYVGGHVDGSLARRKYQRNELWSLISFDGAPSWFVTFSPADNRHPLCIFWSSEEDVFQPDLKLSASARERLITSNPVACARFFHYLVELFLTHILCWDQPHKGVFGRPKAYYGTGACLLKKYASV